MIKKLFTGRMTSRKRFAGKSDFSAKQVSTTFLLLLLCLIMPQKGWADIVTTTYDFAASKDAGAETIEFSSTEKETINRTDCQYFTTLGNIATPGRFAAQNTGSWKFWDHNNAKGLRNDTNGRMFVISKLYKGDIVTMNVVDNYNAAITVTLVTTSNATQNGNEFTMASNGLLAVTIPAAGTIREITIQHDDSGIYTYDPAVEIYDLSGINSGAVTATESAGYKFYNSANGDALILGNPSGYSLNERVVVQNSDFQWANGLQNNGSGSRIVGINNLLPGDRVVITFTGSAVFSSRHDRFDRVFAAAGNVFKDVNNNGEMDEDETLIEGPGEDVESKAVYTMTAPGHLDIALAKNSTITKIEIYGDHEAQMLGTFDPAKGYTAYYSQTGQLLLKENNVGGLEIHVGNENDTQHAIVVSSDEGPVSFVYDQAGYKMARHATWGSFNVTSELPVTGTYYKFIPEVNGKLTMRFKAYSVKYNDYGGDGKASGNESQTSAACPYYFMVQNGTVPQEITSTSKNNGATVTISNQTVEAGKVYYLYGWWNGSDLNADCGVAELIDVTFMPDNLVYPLAKWVESGTTEDEELANVSLTTTNSDLHIKKKSGNISSCEPYVENGVLKIRDIHFKSGENPGGTILIKVGNPSDDAAPVFAYTIAYDASWKPSNWTDNSRTKGHTWDFSTKPLRGLKWTNTSGEADDVDFGKGAGPGLLYDEMHETGPDGSAHSDWTFKYVTEKGDTKRDPMYLNRYSMEGDNADMMWDTEGLIFNTPINLSCINNEFGDEVNHNSGGTATDPDRFVGILNGGSFTIPALEAGDRVVIFMGSANAYTSFFNITGALDAIGKTIEPTDEYNAGGSLWSTMGGACQYRGAYQFISTGGDMTFTLTKGELVKLYSIQIYAGVKLATTDASRPNGNTTYNGDEYVPGYQVFNDWRTETPGRIYLTIHYRGKGERLKVPTVLYKSGTVNTDESHLMYGEVGTDKAPFIFFKSEKDQYGVFRMRIEDYELGNKYVADYTLQNITVNYLDKKNYPYTWDFTDLKGYADTSTRIQAERTKIANYNPRTLTGDYDIEFMNNSVGEDVKTIEQWKEYAEEGGIPAGLGLHVRNEPYSGGLMWDYGQLYAGNEPFGESFGLSMEAPGANEKYNGGLRLTDEGLCLTGGNWTIRVPQVGTVASVYVRAKQVGSKEIVAGVGNAETAFTYVGEATDGTGEKIYAVKGTGEDMKLVFNNLIIKKIAVSQDTKTVNKLGYATESRNVEIDPALMGYMTGTGLKAYTVTNVTYGDKPGDKASVTLTQIPAENVMGKATSGDHRAYIIYNTDDVKPVSILDGGFNLFVPDMHDESTASSPKKSILDVSGNPLVSSINGGSIPQSDGDYTNYLMNYKYTGPDGKQHEGPEAFYRASAKATLGSNKAYLQLLTAKMKPSDTTAGAKIAIVFVNEEQGTETTSLDGVKSTETLSGDNAIYTLSGVKVSKPEKGGIYVKNGKKFIVK